MEENIAQEEEPLQLQSFSGSGLWTAPLEHRIQAIGLESAQKQAIAHNTLATIFVAEEQQERMKLLAVGECLNLSIYQVVAGKQEQLLRIGQAAKQTIHNRQAIHKRPAIHNKQAILEQFEQEHKLQVQLAAILLAIGEFQCIGQAIEQAILLAIGQAI